MTEQVLCQNESELFSFRFGRLRVCPPSEILVTLKFHSTPLAHTRRMIICVSRKYEHGVSLTGEFSPTLSILSLGNV